MTTYTVTTSGDEWVVLKGGKSTSYHRKKSAAVRKAKRLAKGGRGKNRVKIYNRDDSLSSEHTY